MRGVRERLILAALMAAALVAWPASASASSITVTTTADEFTDPGPGTGCSLREAVEAASTDGSFGGCSAANENADTILLESGELYARALTGVEDANASGDIDIRNENLTITTSGGGGATIKAGPPVGGGGSTYDRVIDVIGGITVSLDRVELVDGYTATADGGGGIRNAAGAVNLTDSLLFFNSTYASGGGILSGGTLNASNVTIDLNTALVHGGGIYSTGTVNLNNVTVNSNFADYNGADAIVGAGAGINRSGAGPLNLSNTLVADNFQGGEFHTPPQTSPDCFGTPTSLGHNLIENSTGCGWTSTTGDLTPVSNPLIAPFSPEDNGGPTETAALQPGSPAIDAGNPGPADGLSGHCEATDQRLIPRPVGTRCDIGAFETSNPPPVPPGGSPPPNPPASPGFDLVAAIKKCRKKSSPKRRRKCIKRARGLAR